MYEMKKELVELATEFKIAIRYLSAYSFAEECSNRYVNTNVKYPGQRKQYCTRFNVYKNGKVLGEKLTFGQKIELCEEHKNSVVEIIQDENLEKEYNDKLQQYRDEQNKVISLFKLGLEYLYEIQDHPKADMLYAKAYEQGHSSGITEIHACYHDLVDLIK